MAIGHVVARLISWKAAAMPREIIPKATALPVRLYIGARLTPMTLIIALLAVSATNEPNTRMAFIRSG